MWFGLANLLRCGWAAPHFGGLAQAISPQQSSRGHPGMRSQMNIKTVQLSTLSACPHVSNPVLNHLVPEQEIHRIVRAAAHFTAPGVGTATSLAALHLTCGDIDSKHQRNGDPEDVRNCIEGKGLAEPPGFHPWRQGKGLDAFWVLQTQKHGNHAINGAQLCFSCLEMPTNNIRLCLS